MVYVTLIFGDDVTDHHRIVEAVLEWSQESKSIVQQDGFVYARCNNLSKKVWTFFTYFSQFSWFLSVNKEQFVSNFVL